ncbi:MAG: MerC family mercury resistance protein [Woeseiaceae bacterium]|nr:MerC family mercury resistance protein [Woeseiaceae bacterium]
MARQSKWLDGTAVALSALCLIHCLALPLIVAGLPFLAQFAESHLHAQMLVIVLPLSFVALGLGYRHHESLHIVAGGTLGMFLLVVGATVAHDQLGLMADRVFTISGALILATAHYFNSMRSRHSCP